MSTTGVGGGGGGLVVLSFTQNTINIFSNG